MAKITINHEGNEMEFEGTPEEIKEMLTSMGVKPAELEEKFEEGEEATEGFQVGDYVRVTRNVHEHREGDVLELLDVADSDIFDYDVRNTRFMPYKPHKSRGRTGLISEENIEPIEFIEGAPKVGDKILVVNQRGTLGEYKNGDVLTVVKVENHYVEEYYVYVEEDSVSIGLFRNEFEIIERPEALELQVGATIKITKDSTGTEKHRVGWAKSGQGLMNVGSVGKVTEVTSKGIYAKFDGDQRGAGHVDKSRFYLAHGEYEVISAAEDTPPYEVGDLAVIAEDADEGRLEIGDVVEIIGTGGLYDFETKRLTDGQVEHFDTKELAEYVPEEKELSVGDKVVLAIPKGEKPRFGFGDVKTGDIGEVLSVFGGGTELSIKFDNHSSGWWGTTSEVLLVERAETKAEEAEEGGDEPTTFVKGDIVKIIGRTRFGDVSAGATARVVSYGLDYDGELEVEYLDGSDYDFAKPEALAKVDFAGVGDIIRITKYQRGALAGELVEVREVRDTNVIYSHYSAPSFELVAEHGTYEIVGKGV